MATRGNGQASFCLSASTVIALRIPIIGIAGIPPSARGINSNCDSVGGDSDVLSLNVSAPVGTRVTAMHLPNPAVESNENLWIPAARDSPGGIFGIKLGHSTKVAAMGQATGPDQRRRRGLLTGLRLCEAIEREFPELSRSKIIRILAIVLDDMQRSVNERRHIMKRFDQPDARNQILLITRLITKFADSGYLDRCHGSVAEWARVAGLDPFDIWRGVCADVGLDDCSPWPKYPIGPKDFPGARADHRPLPDKVAKLLEQIERPRTH